MLGDVDDAMGGPASVRPSFDSEAPVGVFNGEQAIIVYDLRPLPSWPEYWMHALSYHFRRQLDPAPKVDISLVDDCIRFCVFVSPEVSVEDLCKLDDVVHRAVDEAGRGIEGQQEALDQKLDSVRQRRIARADDS
jgi:hypothetical protein